MGVVWFDSIRDWDDLIKGDGCTKARNFHRVVENRNRNPARGSLRIRLSPMTYEQHGDNIIDVRCVYNGMLGTNVVK
jgi:hypothetical protein